MGVRAASAFGSRNSVGGISLAAGLPRWFISIFQQQLKAAGNPFGRNSVSVAVLKGEWSQSVLSIISAGALW